MMKMLKVQKLLRRIPIIYSKIARISLNSSSYTVNEIQIQIPNGHLAGKLWKSNIQEKQLSTVPILALHGWLDNAGSFDPLIPLIMQPNLTIFAVDYPGHGMSSHTNHVYYDTHVEGLLAVNRILRHFKWEKVTLLGHSLGAIISFICSAAYPQHIHKYIALDNHRPVIRDYITSLQRITNLLFEIETKMAIRETRPAYTYDEIVKRVYDGRQETITEEGCKILLKRGSVKVEENKFAFSHDIKAVVPTSMGRFSKEQTEAIARRIKCPVCIIKGDPGNNYEPIEDFLGLIKIIQEGNERVEFHQVPGTHHFHLNDPHLTAPIITKFLQS